MLLLLMLLLLDVLLCHIDCPQLTDLWGDQSKIKKEVRQKKLTVSFKSDNATLEKVRTGPAFTLSKAVENAKDTLAHARSSTGSSTGHHSSKHGSSNDEQLWEEVTNFNLLYIVRIIK
jgi:hypothetical protein